MSNIVAWQGTATLKKAQWDSGNGYTVQFALPDPEGEDKSNPFKRFTKMRKNRVGTQFDAIMFDVKDPPVQVYNDGAMLKGWTDSNTGQTVSFWLANVEGGAHPFASYREGEEFALALVELDEDSQAIDQVKRERVEKTFPDGVDKKARRTQSPSTGCAIVCNNPTFWAYLREARGLKAEDAAGAALAVREILGIDSRRELDTSPEIEERWHAEIRKPFVAWQDEAPV